MRIEIRKLFIISACIMLIICVAIFSINEFNKSIMRPNKFEIDLLSREFGSIRISNKKDIFRLQNLVIRNIKHVYLESETLKVDLILEKRYGYCYDRSFLLQKIFIYNKIPIRPVYLFYFQNGDNAKLFDFFSDKINSHSIFEFKWEDEWYVIRTNSPSTKLEKLDEFIKLYSQTVSSEVRYIRYLSNRNSRFLSPRYIPDFFYFN